MDLELVAAALMVAGAGAYALVGIRRISRKPSAHAASPDEERRSREKAYELLLTAMEWEQRRSTGSEGAKLPATPGDKRSLWLRRLPSRKVPSTSEGKGHKPDDDEPADPEDAPDPPAPPGPVASGPEGAARLGIAGRRGPERDVPPRGSTVSRDDASDEFLAPGVSEHGDPTEASAKRPRRGGEAS